MDLNLAAMIMEYVQHPRGTETADWRTKPALPGIEETIDELSRVTAIGEKNHAEGIATLLELTTLCIQCELGSRVKKYVTKLELAASIRDSLAEAPNSDAVWLHLEHDKLNRTELWLEKHAERSAVVHYQNAMIPTLLRRAAMCRVAVKVHGQTLITDYFNLIAKEETEGQV